MWIDENVCAVLRGEKIDRVCAAFGITLTPKNGLERPRSGHLDYYEKVKPDLK